MQPPATLQIPLQTPLQTTQQTTQQTLQQTLQTTPQQPNSDDQDPAECFNKRRLRVHHLTRVLFAHSLVVLVVGLVCATLTENVAVSGYYSGVILTFGAFLGLVGMHLQENRRHMLIAAIIFISLGVIAAFFCAIFDGVIAGEWIDIQPLLDGSCDFYSSTLGYGYDTYYTQIQCPSQQGTGCKLKVRHNSCYCCYKCDSYLDQYHIFEGVNSCWDVVHLHRLLWTSVCLNILAVSLGVITAALLGAYKDLPKPSLHVAPSPAPLPHFLYNPTQHMMTYPMQPYLTQPVMHTPQYHPEGQHHASDQSRVPHPPTQPNQEEGGHPDLYTLTPDAPVLYAAAYTPFVKPPPYAY
ncbi:transmembrane protein 255B [Gadus macrocephalus]|uniref:transmembrane protein 255B n=1 Tax=Gadus macrocephalus TaxID=80720 RepID=UPI0028CB69F2|nr:transmembrane protein 255B [Gadus macrocephalus]